MTRKDCKRTGCKNKALLGLGGLCGRHYRKQMEKNVPVIKQEKPRYWRTLDGTEHKST